MNLFEELCVQWGDDAEPFKDVAAWDRAIEAAWPHLRVLLGFLQGARYRVDLLSLDALMAPLLAEVPE